jgi:hypothetical protein
VTFFITGLPRSRTAWLAVAATTPTSICVHEPIRDVSSFEQLRDAWLSSNAMEAGVADSGLGLYIDRVIREVAPRTLIVERRFSDVLRSFEAYMAGIEIDIDATVHYLTKLYKALQGAKGSKIRRIDYDDLQSLEKLGNALNWLIPGADFSHLPDLMEVNIQVSRGKMLDDLGKVESTWFLQ